MAARPSEAPDNALPEVSVVICSFTIERLPVIEQAIESVRAQTLQPRETILVIDHAPDLLAISRRLWPDLRIVENAGVQGVSAARNTGTEESSGDVVAFLDDDAVAEPQWLERLAGHYRDRRVMGVGGTVNPTWADGRPNWFPDEFDWVVGCSHSGMPRRPAMVRNLVGANSSFRREVLTELSGFRPELGRVLGNPIGCEETDLCIRAIQRWPDGLILYDPGAGVSQVVPPARERRRYFVERCLKEGRSKAILSRLVGSHDGLSSERDYLRRTLPAGFLRGLGDAARGDLSGLSRALAIATGLGATVMGYVQGRGSSAAAARSLIRAGGPLRVLMVTPRTPLAHGGVERHVREVSRRLVAAGLEVGVLCVEPGSREIREETEEGVAIRSVPAWPANRDWRFAPGIWGEMARERWDVVHVQSYHTFVAPLAMLRARILGIPYVLTFHGGGHSSRLRNRLRRLQRTLLRPLLARAERLVAVARFEITAYGRELRFGPERFALIPNGTDLPAGGTEAPGSGNGRVEDGGAPVVLATIGRLERYKGHHRVIEAMPHVLERHPEATLLVVGEGPYEETLRREAEQLGLGPRVEFTSVPAGDADGMVGLLSRTSLVVLLSDFETHPLTALEAAAAGRRLLVADRGGLGELAESGLARAVDPSGPPDRIGAAILEALAEPPPAEPPRLISWDESAAELLALYRSLVLSRP
ncbi:MAG TPA: glycosyltransferase [Solirubrobacterales bacterium]|nr:glycosyltransferase [Solirubrobacterales bacterium]